MLEKERNKHRRFNKPFALITVTANTVLTIANKVVLVDASGGAVQITMPDAGLLLGDNYYVKKIDSSGNAVTIIGV